MNLELTKFKNPPASSRGEYVNRIQVATRAWNRDPQLFMEKFVPMFLQGINQIQKTKAD